MRRLGAVALCLACVAAACSDGDASSETTLAPATTVAATTTPPTTVVTESTEPAPTTAPATTAAPTTTSEEDTLAAVEQAYFDARAAYQAAIQDPANPNLRATIEDHYTGPNLEGVLETLDGFVADGIVGRPNEDEPSQAMVLSAPMFIPGFPNEADMVVCEANSERYFEVAGSPNGTDVLVRDDVYVGRLLVRFELVDGIWRSSSGDELAELTDFEQCAP